MFKVRTFMVPVGPINEAVNIDIGPRWRVVSIETAPPPSEGRRAYLLIHCVDESD